MANERKRKPCKVAKSILWNITWVFKKKYKMKGEKNQLKFTFPKSTSYCEFKTGFRSSVVYVVQK